MSLIQQIRDRAAWILFGAIAISLLAFILQDYFFNKGRGSVTGSGTTLGKINGQSIDYNQFEQKVAFYDQMNNGQYPRSTLIPQIWDFMVNQTLIEQETDKLGIAVTGAEKTDLLFGANPPQFMQQFFTNPQTGLYDVNTAKKQIGDLKNRSNDPNVANFNAAYIEPLILQTKAQKYESLISGAVYIPKWMSEKMNADANSIANASYVYVPYTTIEDSTVKVSGDEMEAYIKKHPKQFERDQESRTISYVTFSAKPSAEDSAAVRTQLEQLKPELASTHDEKTFLSTKSSGSPYYNSVIGAKEIKQSMKDSLFSLAPGQVYGPYLDGSSYVVAKMVTKQQIPDSASVRHILVATHQQDPNSGTLVRVRDDSAAMKRLDSAIALIKSGTPFDSVVAKYSDDPGSKNTGGKYENFPSGQMDEGFNDFAFTGHVGEAKTVQTMYGYHYVQILAQKGGETGYKIAYVSKPIEASAETDNIANNAASQFAAASRNSTAFQENAKKDKLLVMPSQEIGENDFTVAGPGESRELVKWIYDNNVGSVSDPISIGNNYIVAMVTGISKKGLASAAAVQQIVEPMVRNEKKAQLIIAQKMKGSSLEEMSKSAGQPIQRADSISFSAFVVPSLGAEPKFVGAVFNKQLLNKASEPIAGQMGVFAVRSEGVSGVSNGGGMQNQQTEQMLKQQASQAVAALKKSASIKDYRSKFY